METKNLVFGKISTGIFEREYYSLSYEGSGNTPSLARCKAMKHIDGRKFDDFFEIVGVPLNLKEKTVAGKIDRVVHSPFSARTIPYAMIKKVKHGGQFHEYDLDITTGVLSPVVV